MIFTVRLNESKAKSVVSPLRSVLAVKLPTASYVADSTGMMAAPPSGGVYGGYVVVLGRLSLSNVVTVTAPAGSELCVWFPNVS